MDAVLATAGPATTGLVTAGLRSVVAVTFGATSAVDGAAGEVTADVCGGMLVKTEGAIVVVAGAVVELVTLPMISVATGLPAAG